MKNKSFPLTNYTAYSKTLFRRKHTELGRYYNMGSKSVRMTLYVYHHVIASTKYFELPTPKFHFVFRISHGSYFRKVRN